MGQQLFHVDKREERRELRDQQCCYIIGVDACEIRIMLITILGSSEYFLSTPYPDANRIGT